MEVPMYAEISGGKRALIDCINKCVSEGCEIADIEFFEPLTGTPRVRGTWVVRPKEKDNAEL
jgi:hypothetical protein